MFVLVAVFGLQFIAGDAKFCDKDVNSKLFEQQTFPVSSGQQQE
jgi:hypothetical protein